jgi:glycosyltransferase involved in cell wall biosynthesis
MRVAFVAPGGFHPSGREQVVPLWLWLTERLARRHEVHVFVLHHLPEPTSYVLKGAHIHDLGRPGDSAAIGRWGQWRALRRGLAAAGRFDVIHGLRGDPAGLLAAAAGRRLGVPSVVTFDSGELVALPDIEYGLQRTWPGRLPVRLAGSWATRLHVSTSHMERLARAVGLSPARIPMGVDLAGVPFVGDRQEGPPWRLLQVASLNRVKDQRTLLEAVALASRETDLAVDLVGEDTLGGALQERARALGIDGRVTFHGFVPHDRIAPFYARAHLYLQSSRHEAAGVSILEAAATGLPIVGTRVGYVSDWAPEASTSVNVGDPAALADALLALIGDPDRRRAQVAAARRFAVAHDADWTAAAFETLYEDARTQQA